MAANSDIIKIGFDYETGLQEFIKDYDGTMNKVQKSADGKRVEIQFDVSDKDVMKKISALQGDLKNVKIELNGKTLNQQLESVDQLRETLTDIIKLINQGVNIKSIIDSSSINADIEKIENRINDLTKKYENFQKNASDSISGENISLINNEDFKKVQSDVENIKKEIDGLRHNLEQFEQDGYNTGSFVQYLNDQVMSAWENIEKLTSKFEDFHSLVEKLKVDFPETNISSGLKDAFQNQSQNTPSEVVGESAEASAKPIKEEADALDQAKQSATGAAEAKQKFVEANKDVKQSADASVNAVKEEADALKKVETFSPNTSGFDEIIKKLGLTKEEAENVAKIVENIKYSEADGKSYRSYNLTYKNGYKETRGENSQTDRGNVLNSTDTVYDFDRLEKEAEQFNDALNKSDEKIQKVKQSMLQLELPSRLQDDFDKLKSDISDLGKRLVDSNDPLGFTKYEEYVNNLIKAFNDKVKATASADKQSVKASDASVLKEQSNIYSELNQKLTEYQQIKTRIAQNRAYATDEEDAEKLLTTINDLQNKGVLSDDQLTKSQTRLEDINKLVENIQKKTTEKILDSNDKDVANWKAKLEARNVKPKEQSDDYNKILINMKEYYSELKALQDKMSNNAKNGIAPSKEDLTQFDSLKTKLNECTQSFNNMTAAEKGSTAISRDKLYNKIGDYLEKNSGMAKEYKNQFKALQAELSDRGPNANVTDLADRFVQLQARIREAGQEGRSFLDVLKDKVWYGFASQIAMYFSFNDLIRYGKEAVNVIVELDDALVDLKKTTTMSSSDLNQFYIEANDVAKQMGVTTKEIIEQSSAWSRLNKIGPLYGDI